MATATPMCLPPPWLERHWRHQVLRKREAGVAKTGTQSPSPAPATPTPTRSAAPSPTPTSTKPAAPTPAPTTTPETGTPLTLPDSCAATVQVGSFATLTLVPKPP